MEKKNNQLLYKEGNFKTLMAHTYTALMGDVLYVVIGTTVFRMDVQTEHWEKIGTIPVQYQKRKLFDRYMRLYNDNLLFWNFDAGKSYAFDVYKGTGEEIVFDTKQENMSGKSEVYMIVESENRFLFVPCTADKLGVYWNAAEKYEIYRQWKKSLEEKLADKNLHFKFIRYQEIMIHDKRLYLSVGTDGQDLIAVLDADNFDIVDLINPKCAGKNFGVLIRGDGLYFQNITDTENQLVKWVKNGEKVEYAWSLEGEKNRGDIYLLNDKIILNLRNGNIYILDSEQKILRKETVVQGIVSSYGFVAGKPKVVLLNNYGIALWDVPNNICRQFSIPWLDFLIALTAMGGKYEL